MKQPSFGTITTRVDDGDDATITRDGFHGNLPRTRKIWFEESKIIENRDELLRLVLDGMDDFLNRKIKELDFEFRGTQSQAIRIVKRTLVE
jgi:hypothetical protein